MLVLTSNWCVKIHQMFSGHGSFGSLTRFARRGFGSSTMACATFLGHPWSSHTRMMHAMEGEIVLGVHGLMP